MPIVIIVLVVALVGGAGVSFASQDALPGDMLYPVKSTVEQVQLTLPASPEGKADTYLAVAGKRLQEMERANDPAVVAALNDQYATQLAAAVVQIAQAEASGASAGPLQVKLQTQLQWHQQQLSKLKVKLQARGWLSGVTPSPTVTSTVPVSDTDDIDDTDDITDTDEITDTDDISDTEDISDTHHIVITDTLWFSGTMTNTIGMTLTKTLTEVLTLAGPEMPGNSEHGLIAKLQAAVNSMLRGQYHTAQNQLNAFLNQLNAAHQSGHLSDAVYAALVQDYEELSAALSNAQATALTLGGKQKIKIKVGKNGGQIVDEDENADETDADVEEPEDEVVAPDEDQDVGVTGVTKGKPDKVKASTTVKVKKTPQAGNSQKSKSRSGTSAAPGSKGHR